MRLNATHRYRVHRTGFLLPAALLGMALPLPLATAAATAPGYFVVHPQAVPARFDA